jgi:nucleotide-binding universal stress UspA family protein
LAIELALQLADQVEVTALNVVRESLGPTAEAAAREQLTNILEPWEDDPRLSIKVVRASNIIEGIMAEASANYDILLVGASNESYIDRKLFGNVPQTIAADAPPPTVVVRRRASPFRILLRQAGQRSRPTGRSTVARAAGQISLS